MNKRGTGVLFILISTILYCTKYISAIIWFTEYDGNNKEIFNAKLNYIGSSFDGLILIALLIGVVYLCIAERKSFVKLYESYGNSSENKSKSA
jgi:thiamine transporter ThiT